RCALILGRASPFEPRLDAGLPPELVEQARLADSGFADDYAHVAAPRARARPGVAQLSELRRATDQRRGVAPDAALGITAAPAPGGQSVDRERTREAADRALAGRRRVVDAAQRALDVDRREHLSSARALGELDRDLRSEAGQVAELWRRTVARVAHDDEAAMDAGADFDP